MFVVKWFCINNAAFSRDVPQMCLMTSTKTQVTSGQFNTDMCEDTTNTGTLWSQRLCITNRHETHMGSGGNRPVYMLSPHLITHDASV